MTREAFEAQIVAKSSVHCIERSRLSDGYTTSWVDNEWKGWQAAIAHARDVAVRVCQSTRYEAPRHDREHDYNSGCDDCADAIKEALK